MQVELLAPSWLHYSLVFLYVDVRNLFYCLDLWKKSHSQLYYSSILCMCQQIFSAYTHVTYLVLSLVPGVDMAVVV
jgi:hypothetical protein